MDQDSAATVPPPRNLLLAVVGRLALGAVTLVVSTIASWLVLFFGGTYDGHVLTPANITAAHRGQLALLVVAAVCSAPWLATAARRRRSWPLALVIGVLVALPPLQMLLDRLSATDWTLPFSF
jgi:hypothetical protein